MTIHTDHTYILYCTSATASRTLGNPCTSGSQVLAPIPNSIKSQGRYYSPIDVRLLLPMLLPELAYSTRFRDRFLGRPDRRLALRAPYLSPPFSEFNTASTNHGPESLDPATTGWIFEIFDMSENSIKKSIQPNQFCPTRGEWSIRGCVSSNLGVVTRTGIFFAKK